MFQIYSEGSDFSGKELYRQLVDTGLDAWVTKPYKSILTNALCMGCSMYMKTETDEVILCLNLNYLELQKYIASLSGGQK